MPRHLPAAAVLAAFLLGGTPGQAQIPMRPHLDWKTVRTTHFVVHYPAELSEWTLAAAERLESVHGAVSGLVGSAPKARVTVIVADPLNVSNGMALPGPTIFLWPTPPEPRSTIGQYRSWAEILSVHEYAHIAHFTRRSRNAQERALWRLLPVELHPILRRAPRWALEGYATYVEGKLTGSGRPHGVWRAALLRQRALEGRLPTYRELNRLEGFMGGHMAYMAGSAFLEWLVQTRDPDGLPKVWRRMTARRKRSFDAAFAGVYGDSPADLYGRFTAELTGKALEIERTLREAGLVEGTAVQQRDWLTGDPALSPDGALMAVTLHFEKDPSRVVIWRTEPDTLTDRERESRERAQERDPEDVPAVESRPRRRKPVATLHPVAGRDHGAPRFMPDGKHVLVTRFEPLGDGTLRPDLFVWNHETGALRRVTRGEGIRYADPSPDGKDAVGVRCLRGSCDVVRVDLESGAVETLLEGTPHRSFYRPRYSPDGRRIALSAQDSGVWRLATTDARGGDFRYIDPADGASRFDAAWMPDGRHIVAVSEAGGIHNLELLDPASGATRPLTRVTGGAFAPEPSRADTSIYFLSAHARGWDLNRVHPDSVRLDSVISLDSMLAPAAPRPVVAADTFTVTALPPPRPYGLGPRTYSVLPSAWYATEGYGGGVALASLDPVGRLTWVAQGVYGSPGTWRGFAAGATLRRFRPVLEAEAFHTRHDPSHGDPASIPDAALDADYGGGMVAVSLLRDNTPSRLSVRLGASAGRIDGPLLGEGERNAAFTELTLRNVRTPDELRVTESLFASVSTGQTAGARWSRVLATASAGYERRGEGLLASVTYGRVIGDSPPYEHFALGGIHPPLFHRTLVSQRIPMAGLPVATLSGRQILSLRATLLDGSGGGPFFAASTVDPRVRSWYRVLGTEQTVSSESLPLVRIPGIRISAGAVYPLDEPLRRKLRAFLSITYRP